MKTLFRAHSWMTVTAAIASVSAIAITSAQAQTLPNDVKMTCTVPQATFNSWFKSGQPSLNGEVSPANSLALDTSNNCSFYQWSEQMFLWLTSPAGISGQRVLRSPVFYQVNGNNLVSQQPGAALRLAVRAAQTGPNGLPVVIDAQGQLREFIAEAPAAQSRIRLSLANGTATEAVRVQRGPNEKAQFFDSAGKALPGVPTVTADMLPKALGRLIFLASSSNAEQQLSAAALRERIASALTAQHVLIRYSAAHGPLFVEAGTGAIDNLGPGQAGGNGVLISQKNAVIYYETIVNDVYAWYLTGRKTPDGIAPLYNKDNPGNFPTTQADLNAIVAFAKAHGGPATFPDANALAIEVKLSWVDASTVSNPQAYITTQAEVPVYKPVSATIWKQDGTKRATVALVGVHIVGSTKGHPEMLWATFEHQGNSPLAAYTYTNQNNQTVPVAVDTAGSWLFSASAAGAPYNAERAKYDSANQQIVAVTDSIGPSNVLRMKAWGVGSNGQPNQLDATAAASNTEILSLNSDIISKFTAANASADPRANYLHFGTTWTFGGGQPGIPFPNGSPYTDDTPVTQIGNNNVVGTSVLMNSTMETFQQGAGTDSMTGTECFGCHNNTGNPQKAQPAVPASTKVSHIFSNLSPLSLTAQINKMLKN